MDTLGSVDGRTKAVIESASSEQFASEATYEEYINQLWCFFSFLLTSRLMHLFNFLKPLMLRSGLLRWNWFQNSENLFFLNQKWQKPFSKNYFLIPKKHPKISESLERSITPSGKWGVSWRRLRLRLKFIVQFWALLKMKRRNLAPRYSPASMIWPLLMRWVYQFE